MRTASRIVRFGTAPKPKFGNKPTVRNGIQFDSLKEATRYSQLLLLEKAGRIRNIRLQVEFRLEVGGALICKYRADFAYDEFIRGEWQPIVEDVKGYATAVYRLKKKLMRACHGVEIRET